LLAVAAGVKPHLRLMGEVAQQVVELAQRATQEQVATQQ
jgi:hypothetical protein